MKICKKCGSSDSYKDSSCRPCKKAGYAANPEKHRTNNAVWRKSNAEKKRAKNAAWQKANPGKCCAIAAKRYAIKLRATPKWFEEDLVEALYIEANKITIATGIKHNVDHIVPLQSDLVQGLHCLANLQIISKSENVSKGNRYWPDMP